MKIIYSLVVIFLSCSACSAASTLDIPYGNHERQKLDIHMPDDMERGPELLPTVIFFPGGGFRGGDKSMGAGLVEYFSSNGIVAINANYRLAPEFTWPSGTKDLSNVIHWVHSNGEDYGVDPKRIFIMGHSAGAAHVASYVFLKDLQVLDDGVVGAILSSGSTYELNLNLNEERTQLASETALMYFGSDVSEYAKMSPIGNLEGRRIPLLLGYAENDLSNVQVQTAALINALYQRDGVLPTVIQGIGLDHQTMLSHIVLGGDSVVASQYLSFIRAH